MAVILPWPPKELNPNARIHHMAKARAAKHYREQAHWLTIASRERAPVTDKIALVIRFFPPDNRRRDLDNMLSSIKAGIDGIADALCVNDQRFSFTISREAPVEGGQVMVAVMPAELGRLAA